ncbi:MAG TPA: tRNA preQ1(34) S-adenosylmethionine ribosyltransferase-isomerase QueA [Anaerolineales bacterium]|nr:tRNA preQ1(34) S-adenosylmethionine ribosyltransferase-isomerase QueA [Anaerolineales bacterium]
MKTSDFDYDLPPEFIAQNPADPRDSSRLMVLNRATGAVEHHIFRDLEQFLRPGDLLVINETRVIPARLYARKVPTGGRLELLLLRREDARTWESLVGGKGLRPGRRIQLEENGPAGEIIADLGGPRRLVRFDTSIEAHLDRIGHVPLPPYIHAPLEARERYQTVYAREPGSAAAPTAGLHFTPGLMKQLQSRGVKFASVVLHIGLDTFAPVHEENPQEHEIHTEWCQLTSDVAEQIRETKRAGGRVIAVGTTSVRTLESAARGVSPDDVVRPLEGPTDLFILPGYTFQVVDAMITNFHLPRSTLVMLVSAFAGRERVLTAYEMAKRAGYRFYSFGDAMLIL